MGAYLCHVSVYVSGVYDMIRYMKDLAALLCVLCLCALCPNLVVIKLIYMYKSNSCLYDWKIDITLYLSMTILSQKFDG